MPGDMRIHFLHIYSVLKFCSKLVRLLEESQTDGPVRTCRDVNNLLILHYRCFVTGNAGRGTNKNRGSESSEQRLCFDRIEAPFGYDRASSRRAEKLFSVERTVEHPRM